MPELGVRGLNGAKEKEVVFKIAQALKTAIETRLQLTVLLTREGDETVPVDARARRPRLERRKGKGSSLQDRTGAEDRDRDPPPAHRSAHARRRRDRPGGCPSSASAA